MAVTISDPLALIFLLLLFLIDADALALAPSYNAGIDPIIPALTMCYLDLHINIFIRHLQRSDAS